MRKIPKPNLAFDHPGFYSVLKSIVLIHFLLLLDGLFRTHGPAFDLLRTISFGTLYPYAMLHGLCALLIIVGMYVKDKFVLARLGCMLSVALFNATAATFIFAAIQNDTISFYGAICSVGLAIVSYAAILEPRFNPAALFKKEV